MIAKGGESLSMRKLSHRLGISRTAAYHHFDNKDELMAAVGRHGFRRLADRVQSVSRDAFAVFDALLSAVKRCQAEGTIRPGRAAFRVRYGK